VAGPIVRARDFLPQVRRRKRWDWARLHLGMQFLVMGLFKKLAIADRMALFADPVFANPGAYNTGALWMAALAYAVQVYCDFSGYTDMALGCAHLLGYKLAQNFNLPYLAANITELWRRWHISLSGWLRDYLFIPLGGSRGGRLATWRNLLITMTLAGLWHGAGWNYVTFGLIQGVWLCLHQGFRDWCGGRARLTGLLRSSSGTALRVGLTFTLWCCTLVVFRTPTIPAALTMLQGLTTARAGLGSPMAGRSLWFTVALVALCHALARHGRWQEWLARLPAPVRGFGYATVLTLALVLALDADRAFIYFQF
jgi:alginate O-acetyltransferase complex protein AlgI